jgi:hypothetical protein
MAPLFTRILLAGLIATPPVALASTPSPTATRHVKLIRHARLRRPLRMPASLTGPIAPPPRAQAPLALAPVGDRPTPTAIDYPLGSPSLVGSVGFHRIIEAYPRDPHEVNSAASTRFGYPDSTLGASLNFTFK